VPDEEPLTCVDLSAGAGGLSLDFHCAGFRIVQAVEEDKWAAATFARNLAVACCGKTRFAASRLRRRRTLVGRWPPMTDTKRCAVSPTEEVDPHDDQHLVGGASSRGPRA
jgi:site-specific DNA-cytosine methylase